MVLDEAWNQPAAGDPSLHGGAAWCSRLEALHIDARLAIMPQTPRLAQ
jgi:hypothetical protein